MKKYLQITVVLGIFAGLVVLRQIKGNDQPVVVGSQNSNPVPSQPNPTSSQSQASVTVPVVQPTNPVSTSSITLQAPTATSTPKPQGQYKDGSYTGNVQDAFYGNIQVQAVINGGKITDVIFLQAPNDNRTSQYINSQADPMLKQEAIQAQSAQVDGVSGASASSQAFQASLANALAKAQ
jgi:uncharacterized protein with FMN-binding domain